ncbi:protein-glutamate O-methyltransferase CheR [Archangium minus]|uniref:protein-glutamate O-methyltransferase n=1 Tax=Archangium minus TaxID=83450 RepID=A0ABY9X717_9BACT|nr:protein-glutamate O-methyltransferase CheR [Archangium violaceum]WNG51191.1 protein-glutamate O-methyltransferase CheR [Archangium minus]
MSESIQEEREPGPSPEPSPITDKEFTGYQRLVYREAGIWLSPVKRALLVGRISRRLRELGGLSYGAYLRKAEEDAAERVRLLDAICTHETHFFREPKHFDFLERVVLPQWRERGDTGSGEGRRVRVWSAGCSSGEEPFTLAMVLRHHLPQREGWDIQVLATDLSTRVLERARQALWPLEKSEEIPTHYLRAYMLKGTGSQEGKMKAGPELRELVRFQRVNLNDGQGVVGRFDLIFCRNVLIYFDAASKERAVDRLLNHLSPNGLLFLGHSESLSGLGWRVRTVMPTVYAPRG